MTIYTIEVRENPKLQVDNAEVPKPNGVVGGSIPSHEIVSLLDVQLARCSSASCVLTHTHNWQESFLKTNWGIKSIARINNNLTFNYNNPLSKVLFEGHQRNIFIHDTYRLYPCKGHNLSYAY